MSHREIYVPGNEYTVAVLILVIDDSDNFKVVMRKTGEDMLELPSITDTQDDYHAVVDLVIDDLHTTIDYGVFKKGFKERIVLLSPLTRVYLIPVITNEFTEDGLVTILLSDLTKNNLSRMENFTTLTSNILNSQGAQSMIITLKSFHPSGGCDKNWKKTVKSYGFNISFFNNTKWKHELIEAKTTKDGHTPLSLHSNIYDLLNDC